MQPETNKKRVAWNKGLKYPNGCPWLKGKHGQTNNALISYHKNHPVWNKGKKANRGEVKTAGENHYLWKGDDVGYSGLHKWVRTWLGKPESCIKCGEKNKMIHWANVSGEYKRELHDWMRLCVSCHKKYDLKRLKNNI